MNNNFIRYRTNDIIHELHLVTRKYQIDSLLLRKIALDIAKMEEKDPELYSKVILDIYDKYLQPRNKI